MQGVVIRTAQCENNLMSHVCISAVSDTHRKGVKFFVLLIRDF